jgi:zinc and cadmium transporter
MTDIWVFSLISVFLVGLVSFTGILFLAVKRQALQKILLFLVSFATGGMLGVALHEIPQEIGDFGVLIYGGFRKTKALLFNFASALMAVVGVLLTLSLGSRLIGFVPLVISFTAGGFIYIAGSDLIPELHKKTDLGKSATQLIGLLFGISVMLGLTLLE